MLSVWLVTKELRYLCKLSHDLDQAGIVIPNNHSSKIHHPIHVYYGR